MFKKQIELSVLLLTAFFSSSYGQFSAQAVNLSLNSGLESGTVEIQTSTFEYNELYEPIYETKKVGNTMFKLGVGYNYIFGPRFGYGFEFSAGLGVASTNSYEYSGGGVPGIRSYEVKEKLDFIGLGYLLDFAVLGDLEGEFAVTISPEIGIQGSRFVTTFEDYDAIFVPYTDYSREIEWHGNTEEDKIQIEMFSAFFKIGGAVQYQVAEYWYAFGGLKYTFTYSGSDNDFVKRNNWLDLDLGFRFMLY